MTFHRAAFVMCLGAAALGSACTTETSATAPTAVGEDGIFEAARAAGPRRLTGLMTIKGDALKIDPAASTMLVVDYNTPSPDVVPVPVLVMVLASTTVTVNGQPGKLGQIEPGYKTTVEGSWRPRWFEAYTVTATTR